MEVCIGSFGICLARMGLFLHMWGRQDVARRERLVWVLDVIFGRGLVSSHVEVCIGSFAICLARIGLFLHMWGRQDVACRERLVWNF